MLQVSLDSVVRTVFGKGPMRQLRMREITPANLYSGGTAPVSLQFETSKLYKSLLFIHRRNAVVTLQVAGDSKEQRHVLIQEIQKEPVSGNILHVDFIEIDLKKPAKFTDLGGELQVFKDSIQLRGCPMDIPDVVKVDISPLEQGGAGLTYNDLAIPENVEMLEKSDVTCVIVY